MGPATGHSEHKRIAVLPTGPPNALQVVRLGGRHRAQNGARQIPNVDAHFQCGRAGKQVGIPGFSGRRVVGITRWCFELKLHLLAFGPIQKACVLFGKDALQVAF